MQILTKGFVSFYCQMNQIQVAKVIQLRKDEKKVPGGG